MYISSNKLTAFEHALHRDQLRECIRILVVSV